MHNIKDLLANTKKIYGSRNFLEQLMDFERVLDSLNLYVFKNWIRGELVEGPTVSKYWVSCKFMYPKKMMPDPRGGEKLLSYGCIVNYTKDILETPIEIETPSDFQPGTKYPKMVKRSVWIVEIIMPKKLMSDIERGSVDLEDEVIDMEDLQKADEQDLEAESMQTQDQQDMGSMTAPGTPPEQAPAGATPNV
jgi:hypothetical protein